MLLRSKQLGQDFELSDGIHLIGRSRQCQIVLESHLTAVSREHAKLKVAGKQVQIFDCESHNGTYVNGKKIPKAHWCSLHLGDKVMICEFDFILLAEAENEGSTSSSCLVDTHGSSILPDSKAISLSAGGKQRPENVRLRAMLVIAQSLRNALHTDEVLAQAIAKMFEIFPGVERAVIGLVNAQGQVEPKFWQQRDPTSKGTIRLSQTILQHVVSHSEALIAQDAFSNFKDSQSLHELNIRSVMVAPLFGANEQVIGVLYVDAKPSHCFKDFDLEVLAAVATQISLALSFAQLHKIALNDAVLRRDVEQATAVQRLYLPHSAPSIPGYELASFYQPARLIGGDYYDFIPLNDGRLAIIVGDVEGKGVPAALSMMRLATETRATLEICSSPGQAMTRLNRKIQDDIQLQHNLTLLKKTQMKEYIQTLGNQISDKNQEKLNLRKIELQSAGNTLFIQEKHDSCFNCAKCRHQFPLKFLNKQKKIAKGF